MTSYLLRYPEKKRIVDVKSFVEKGCQNSDHRNYGDRCIASRRISHLNQAAEPWLFNIAPSGLSFVSCWLWLVGCDLKREI
jgi:hypothetical protein